MKAIYRKELVEAEQFDAELPLYVTNAMRHGWEFDYEDPLDGEEFDDAGNNILIWYAGVRHPAKSIDFEFVEGNNPNAT